MEKNKPIKEFNQTLDTLIATEIGAINFIDLMRKIEDTLDHIQLRYSSTVYESLNNCYVSVLMSKREYEVKET